MRVAFAREGISDGARFCAGFFEILSKAPLPRLSDISCAFLSIFQSFDDSLKDERLHERDSFV